MTRTESYTVAQNGDDFVPLDSIPYDLSGVTVNGVSKTVTEWTYGGSVPVGFDFYWNDEHAGFGTYGWAIGDPSQGLHLNKGDVIGYTYLPSNSGVISVENPDLQIEPLPNTGEPTGIWETMTEEHNITSIETAEQIAEQVLAQFGSKDILDVSFGIDDVDVHPGQRIQTSIARYALNEPILVTHVESEWLGAKNDFLRHTVRCASIDPETGRPHGELGNRATSYFEKLARNSRIGENAIDVTTAPGTDGSGTGFSDGVMTFVDLSTTLATGDNLGNQFQLALKSGLYFYPLEWLINVNGDAPTGSSIIVQVEYSTDRTSWTPLWGSSPDERPSIAAAGTSNSGTGFAVESIIRNAWIRWNIEQVGSSTAGGILTLQIRGRVA